MEVPNTTILNKKIISLKGEISRYGMNQNGLLYAVIYEHITDKLIDSRLIGISMEAGILWEHKGQLSFPIELRIDPNSGKAYISQNNTISYVNQLGVTEKEITLEVEEHQEIGSFVILPNGFIISLQSKGKPNTAVIRTDFNGNIIWKRKIEVNAIAYKGLVQMRRETNWEMEQIPAFNPENWVCLYQNELLIANTNLLASFYDMPRSGVGKSYCLDLETGKLKWDTKTAPMESIAAFRDGKFLIGHTGYGAFNSKLYTTTGHIIDEWKTAGKYLISSTCEMTLVETNSYSKGGDNYVSLKGAGEIISHQSVNGHFVIYPVLDEFGNCVFWGNGQLILIDKEKERHILMTKKMPKRIYNSPRILLYQKGILVFSLNKELYILETTLGRRDEGGWTMKFGNLERNPVF